MKKLKGILVLVLLLALLVSPIAVLASDISGARYYGTIIVSNNSTATTNVAVNCTISTQALIDGGYLNSSANNCVVRSSAGADLPFMPSVNASYPWCVWVPSIGQNSHISDILYTANSTGGKIRYFPAVGGMTTTDSTSLKLGDNFTIEQSGWWNTDNGTEKKAVYKFLAFETYISSAENITSSIGTATLDFDGADDLVTCDNETILHNIFDGGGSIEAWINADSDGEAPGGKVCAKFSDAIEGWLAGVEGESAGKVKVEFFCTFDDTNGHWRTTATEVAINTWTHIAITYDSDDVGNNPLMYVDGSSKGVAEVGTPVGTRDSDIAAPVTIGNKQDKTLAFEGEIAEVRVYDDILTPTEVAEHAAGSFAEDADLVMHLPMNEGAGLTVHDMTANDIDGTIDGATWGVPALSVTATGVASGEHKVKTTETPCLTFDGSNDRVYFSDVFDFERTDPFSLVVWAQADNFTGGAAFIAKMSHLSPYAGWDFYYWTDSKLTFSLRNSTVTSNQIHVISDNAYTDTTNFHCNAVTYDGSSNESGVTMYRDGSGIPSTGVGDTLSSTTLTAFVTMIGVQNANAQWFAGKMDGVSVYNIELSPTAIAEIYNDTYDETGLVGQWNFDEGQGATAYDSSVGGNDGIVSGASWTTGALKIYVDDVLEDVAVGENVTGNAYDWAYYQNMEDYWEYTEVTVNGTQVQYIDWEYATTFQDSSDYDNDATPTFRTTSSDADVSAVLTSFLPVSEAKAPSYALAEAPAFIETVPLIVSEWGVTPPAGTFPLAGVIAAVASATDTPAQLPLLLIAAFVIIACSLAISATMRRYGSGSLIIKSLVITALMGVFIGIGNFGIDFWMLVVFLIIAIAFSMGSKQIGWQ